VTDQLTIPDFLKVENRGQPMAITERDKGGHVLVQPPAKPLVHSYSSLNAYIDICPYRYYRTYVVRDVKYVETPERKKGNQTHDALADRIGGKPLPADLRHLEKWVAPLESHKPKAEGKVAINRQGKPVTYFAGDVWLRGALDVTIVHGETGYILDWKDGKSRWEKRFELDVHAVLLHARHPHLKTIRAQYCYTTEDRLSDLFDCSATTATWNRILDIVGEIEQTQEFEKKENPLCRFCDVIDCENNKK
jgi:hypothetical protein